MKLFFFMLILFQTPLFAQTTGKAIATQQQAVPMHGFNGSGNAFIKNIGQYGGIMASHANMGYIRYGYEGGNMLVLFTPKGLIHIHRKIKRPTKREEEALERKGVPEEEIEQKVTVIDKTISMEWKGSNPDVEIIAEEETTDYHTYGLIQDKAYGYKKITYKNLYPGIDVVYHFTNTDQTGFNYSIVLQPGADASLVKLKYSGDVKDMKVDKDGSLVINSGINGVIESTPAAFSNTDAVVRLTIDKQAPQQLYKISYQLQNKVVSFNVPGYDKTKTCVIDPFVSNTNTLTGTNAGKAIDIDFDYAGNIYVSGGGNNNACRLAKYDASGTLLWTFDGTLVVPNWTWHTYGGWVVEKSSGSVFTGQGATFFGGTLIRLSSAGVYDNYISNPNTTFLENWKMLWNCNNGNPQILVAGGGNNSNINLGVCSPPSANISGINITGIIPTFYQDIADVVVDPLTNDMYTIFASPDNTTIPINSTPGIHNHIFKHSSPYSASSIAWEVPTGYNSLFEIGNRPYLSPGSGFSTNSLNALAINSSYLYYWDGLYLKAFNKANGSSAGLPLTLTGNAVLMQGGIFADECNNIFIGNVNGTIKVYQFDGISFNDAAAPDISISGFPMASVYDLAYDDARKVLYASGDGFVASFDISSYCTANGFNLMVNVNCPAFSVQATINPAPPVGTTLTYGLFVGTTQIATNSTGLFTGLASGINYSIKAFLNQACSGVQLMKNFTLDECLTATFINPSCNLSNGSIHAVGSFGVPPLQYSKDGINFQLSGIFTGLAAGNYTIIAKDANNLRDTVYVTLVNALPLQVNAIPVATSCTQNTGTITASGSGGSAPLKYSIDGTTFQSSGFFPGLANGNYTITVKDTNNCMLAIPVHVDSLNTVSVNAGVNVTICEGNKTTLQAQSNGNSFLWSPATGLTNPNMLTPDAAPVLTTAYTLTATTGICKAMGSLTVFVKPAPVANAGRDTGICAGNNAQLNGSGGGLYAWSPVTYLSAANIANPIVQQPAVGSVTYRLSVTGVNGCSSLKEAAVIINVSPPAKLFAGNDTSIAINQPLHLQGIDINNTGFNNYTWSPAYGLSNPFVKDPVAILNRDMMYSVIASNAYGCTAASQIKIKVYEGPEIYVPNAFTPGGDGLNDELKPVVIGMKSFHYFRVFNSYGQMVYATTNATNGWNGNFKGVKQAVGTYIWMAEGIDYRGNKIQRNGSVILIR